MSQQSSPFLEAAYGWDFGEDGWNTGMDQNLLKFSFMFDRNVDGVVGSLPMAVNGQAFFLTTDNRLYFAVSSTWYSSPTPKWFEFKIRSTGVTYQFNGTSAVQIDSPSQIDSRLDAVELTVASLGSAAFEDSEFFATQAALDVAEANAQAYTDSSIAGLTGQFLGAEGAGKVGFDSDEVYPASTVGSRLNKYITVTDSPFNAIADSGTTDNTAAILAAAIAAGPRGAIYIPPLVGYNKNTLFNDPSYPIEVVVFDDSLINGGYLKDKTTGIFEKGDGTAESDTTFVVSSGHNAGIFLDNTGKAGGGGGPSRNVGITWTSGTYSEGAIPGAYRPILRSEWNGSGSHVQHTMRKRAPWAAVADQYFRWSATIPVAVTYVGRYCVYQNRFYVSASTGTTGSTPLTHTAGTVSDGGVDWTYVQFSYDQGFYSINDFGRIAINAAIGTNFRRDRMSVDDPGDMVYSHESVGNSKNIVLNYLPTDSGGSSTGTKQISVSTAGFTYTVDSVIAGAFLTSGFNQRGLVKVSATAAALDTTPTVANIGRLVLNNASATSITTLDDGVTNQEVELVFQTANTTLVHSSSFVLQGSVNVTPTANSVITMTRAPYSAIWIEVSRSIK